MKLKSTFLRNVLKVFSGNVFAQIISLGCYPLLTRLFESEQFGKLAVFTSVASIIGTSISYKYELAIPIPKNGRNGYHLSITGITLACITTLSLELVFYLFIDDIQVLLLKNDNSSGNWILLIPLAGLFISLFQNFNYWLIRNDAFSAISINKIYQTSFIAIVSILLGYYGVALGLIIGYTSGNFMAAFSSTYQSIRHHYFSYKFSLKRALTNLRQYSHFPKYQALPSLFNNISVWLPNLLIAFHFGDSQAGFFSIGRMLVLVPTYIISEAISKVLFKKITDKINEGLPIARNIKQVIVAELAASLIAIIPAYFLLKPIVVFVFGEEWGPSADVALIILIPALMRFIVGSTSLTLISLNRLKPLSIWQTANLIILLSFYLLKGSSFNEFIIILSIAEFIMYTIYLVLIVYSGNRHDRLQNINTNNRSR